MRLQISSNIDNNRVRLDFRKSPDRPDNVPSYEIENTKADEFVKKYNAQCEKLDKIGNTIIAATSLIGAAAALKIALGKYSLKFVKAMCSIALGILSGTVVSAIISSNSKNKLMDQYNVREIQNKK